MENKGSASSWGRPGPIPRDLSKSGGRSTGAPVFAKLLPVIMGPGLRRDDSEEAVARKSRILILGELTLPQVATATTIGHHVAQESWGGRQSRQHRESPLRRRNRRRRMWCGQP